MSNENAISQYNGITDGVIWKEMLKFFYPLVIGSLVQQLYNTMDAIIVGRYLGKVALAAVGGSAANITFMLIQFFAALSAGATVTIAQYYGARNKEGLHKALHTAMAFAGATGVLVTIAGIATSPALLRVMDTPDELMADSILYLNLYFTGALFMTVYNMGSSIMRAVGDSKRPLIYLGVCSGVNVFLDVLFIMLFHWGVAGAALATVVAQAISAILVVVSLMKGYDEMQYELRETRVHRRVLLTQLRLGTPGGLQCLMYGVTNIIIQAVVNSYGTDTIAAWAAYFKADIIFWAVCGSFGVAATTFCGQNYGAGNYHRVIGCTRAAVVLSTVINGVILIVLILLARPLLMLFVADEHVIEIGVYMMHCLMPFYMISVFLEVLNGALRGLGDVMMPTAFTLGALLLIRVPWLLIVVPQHKTIFTLVISYPLAWFANLVVLTIYYYYRRNKRLHIHETNPGKIS